LAGMRVLFTLARFLCLQARQLLLLLLLETATATMLQQVQVRRDLLLYVAADMTA